MQPINTGCLNIHGTHVTLNNSTNDNVFFFVSDLKIVFYNNYELSITMPSTKKEKGIFHHYLFGDKIIQNFLQIDVTINMIMIHFRDKKLKNDWMS